MYLRCLRLLAVETQQAAIGQMTRFGEVLVLLVDLQSPESVEFIGFILHESLFLASSVHISLSIVALIES